MLSRTPINDRFKSKVAIVTGGSFGIGKAVVEELCREGASVAFSGIEDEGSETEKEFREKGFDVIFLRGDMVEESFCKQIVEITVEKWDRIDYLVNNAFSFVAEGLEAKTEDWQRSYLVGPVAYSRMVQNVVDPMRQAGAGAIVNVSSISGHVAQVGRWTYNASKGAVNQLTRCQALDLAKHNIRVNSVSPGWIWTREVYKAADIGGGGREKWDPIWGKYHMLKRCGDTIECAGPILFLLSDDASFVTGTDLPIDGGYLGMGPEGIGETAIVAGSK